MKNLLTDPVVLVCSGIILLGLIALVWAIKKFQQTPSAAGQPQFDSFSLPVQDHPRQEFRAPVFSEAPSSSGSPAVTKEVSARLDSMTQRLAEMQSVLQRQTSGGGTGAIGGAAGGVGQGFSPETVEKLLKIIGNVIQQVDILQKSLNGSKEPSADKQSLPSTPPLSL